MKMEKINEKDIDGIEKMLKGGGGNCVGGGGGGGSVVVGGMKTMKSTAKTSSSGTMMINGTIHEELEAHMNPCNYLLVDELGVAGNPVLPPNDGGIGGGGGGGNPFANKQKLQTGANQNGTPGNLIQIPIPMHHRSSRSIRSLKRPQPQPHICILDKTVDNLDVYINVLSWTRIVKPEKTNDPIPLYGGMRVISGSVTYKPLLIYAVTVNPIVLENTKRLCGNTTAQQSLMTLMVDFVEAMNPDLKLKRQPKILIDRDLTGELKEIWLALHSKRERDKFRVLEESYYLYEEFGPPGSATTTSPPSLNSEFDGGTHVNVGSHAVDGPENCAQSDSNPLNLASSSSQDNKGINSDSSSITSTVPFTKKPAKGTECDNKTTAMNVKTTPAIAAAGTILTSVTSIGTTPTSGGGKIKSPSDDVTPSPQTTVIQNTKNRTSHIPILGIKDKDKEKDNKENKEKEKKDKSGGDQSPIQRSIDFLAGISFFKSKNHENNGSGGGNGGNSNGSGGGNNSSGNNNSADNNKSNGGNKKKDKNSNSSNSNNSNKSQSASSKPQPQQPSQQQQQSVRNSSNSNDSSNTGRNDKISSNNNSNHSNDDGGGE